MSARTGPLSFSRLPVASRLYLSAVVIVGTCGLAACFPFRLSNPVLFASLLVAACVTSAWKVNLPMPLSSGSTLSVSYAADLTALLLLGVRPAMVIAAIGVWTQCTFKVKQRYPSYRTAFSVAAENITMWTTGWVYVQLGGVWAPHSFESLPRPLVAAIAAYFFVNTGLVAFAIASSTRQRFWKIWHDDFLWSGTSFIVAGTVGGVAAVVIANGEQWLGLLLIAPIYFVYRTYHTIVGRLDDHRRHLEETRALHEETICALTQARRAEQALTAEKGRLAVTLAGIADGVIATDMEGTIVLINRAAEGMTGWSHDAAVGRPLADVFQTLDPETHTRCDNSVASLATSAGQNGRRCTLLVARDLSERPIEESAAPLRDDYGRVIGMVLAFCDITNVLKVQEERARANRHSALGLLAGGIGHDFNQILMMIVGNIGIARKRTHAESAADALIEAEGACLRARELVWQLLTFSIGSVPVRKPVMLARATEEAVESAMRGSNVDYALDIAQDLWSLEADEEQLVQALTNVLINARQATMHGGVVVIRAENVVQSVRRFEYGLQVEPGRYVCVSVADSGPGVAAKDLGRIFDPYFTTKNQATGLGLATTHSIVRNHGGFVTVDSKVGQGTTMSIHLPATTREAVSPEHPAVAPEPCWRSRVLIMDDEIAARSVAANMLDVLGYQAEAVESGTVAIDRFTRARDRGRPFDVVLLDQIVPGDLGAKETIDRLTRIDPTVKAVLVSGSSAPADADYQKDGFEAVISKPFTLQELNTMLHVVLASGAYRVH
jgi:PAS domain S-box-containing protein